jgi:hypothetical protein
LDIEQQISHARSPLVYEFWRRPGGHPRRVNGNYTEIPSRVNETHGSASVRNPRGMVNHPMSMTISTAPQTGSPTPTRPGIAQGRVWGDHRPRSDGAGAARLNICVQKRVPDDGLQRARRSLMDEFRRSARTMACAQQPTRLYRVSQPVNECGGRSRGSPASAGAPPPARG